MIVRMCFSYDVFGHVVLGWFYSTQYSSIKTFMLLCSIFSCVCACGIGKFLLQERRKHKEACPKPASDKPREILIVGGFVLEIFAIMLKSDNKN